jgi:GNAT superfamily N-acetyltransferase
MDIIDLTDQHKPLFSLCLEDWSDEAREAGPRRAQWVERFTPKGLRAKLAVTDDGVVGGMIQHLPVEHSMIDGRDLRFVLCIWVHGHKQGPGNLQKRGMGSALLAAAEEDARASGAKGMAAWGLWLPFWMRAGWFKQHGYRPADRQGMMRLMWKPFASDATPPRWFKRTKKAMELVPGRVTVTGFSNGWCMGGNLTFERAKRAAAGFGDRVAFREIDTSDRTTMAEWGLSDAVFVDGRELTSGPPLSYEKIRRAIEKRVARLPKREA